MTSFASSATSAWSQGEDAGWRSGASSVTETTLNGITTATNEAKNADYNGERDLWFYSNVQKRLAEEKEAKASASPAYGNAATTLRQRARPASADTANVIRFDLLPPATLTNSMQRMRTEASTRATLRRDRLRLPLHPTRAGLRSAGNSVLLLAPESATNAQDGVGRLVNALNACDAQQGQLLRQASASSPTRRSLRPSHNNSYIASSFRAPHAPTERSGSGSGSRRRPSAKAAVTSHLVKLTKTWVAAENNEETAAGQVETTEEKVDSHGEGRTQQEPRCRSAGVVKMPPYRTAPTHAAPLANSSCVMRLRKSKFEPLDAAVVAAAEATTTANALPASATATPVQTARGEPLDGLPSSPLPEKTKTTVTKSSTEAALEERLLAEPIRSYRILKDATTPATAPHPSSHIPLLSAARMRRANLERLAHNFEHQRYVLHGELEDALVWRAQCQSAVLRRRSTESSADTHGAAALPPHLLHTTTATARTTPAAGGADYGGSADGVYQGLLEDVFARRSHRRPKTAPALRIEAREIGFRSAWTKEAAREALKEEKGRLTQLLTAFEPDCGAAALTLADVEDLRAETIKRVWQPEAYAGNRSTIVYYREHFLTYVQTRYPLNVPTLASAGEVRLPHDILEALPSKAEVAFAKYAYELLPSCGSVSA